MSSVKQEAPEARGQRKGTFVLVFPYSTLAALLGMEGKLGSMVRR